SLFMTKADKCAKEADTAAFSRLNWTTMLIVASAYAVIAFLCTYLAQGVCYIQVSNLLPVAVLGAGFAVYEFFNAKSRQQAQPQPVASKNEEEDYSNGI
ncbi:PTS sugar transporter subunit IIC, partial [Escherichia coli]